MKHVLTALVLCLGALATTSAVAAPKGCPPGLAKKSPECVPPGLAKTSDTEDRYDDHHRYRVGERIEGDYIVIRDPNRWGLDPQYTYYRTGEEIFRVDRETRQVLDFIGLAATLLRN